MIQPPHSQAEQEEDQQQLLLSGSQVCHSLDLIVAGAPALHDAL